MFTHPVRCKCVQAGARSSNVSFPKWLPGMVAIIDQLGAIELERSRRVGWEDLREPRDQFFNLSLRQPGKRVIRRECKGGGEVREERDERKNGEERAIESHRRNRGSYLVRSLDGYSREGCAGEH